MYKRIAITRLTIFVIVFCVPVFCISVMNLFADQAADTSYLFPGWFFPLVLVLIIENQQKMVEIQRRINKIKKQNREKGIKIMNESVKGFIGKECIVSTMTANYVGSIESVEDNWITVKSKKGRIEVINLDHISRIREK